MNGNVKRLNSSLVPKKKFGQNFLVNKQMQKKIVDRMKQLSQNYPELPILEIGPGQGDLTQHFVDFGKEMTAIEIDREAIQKLESDFRNYQNLNLIVADALELVSQNSLPLELKNGFILLSNLPFNVGSRIMVDLPIYYPQTPFAVILQKEVAQKVRPTSDFTFFGAWLNLFWNLKIEFNIAPGNFYPSPKVYSSLLVGMPKSINIFQNNNTFDHHLQVRSLLQTLFGKPRKTITNNLKGTDFEYLIEYVEPNARLDWSNYEEFLTKIRSFKK